MRIYCTSRGRYIGSMPIGKSIESIFEGYYGYNWNYVRLYKYLKSKKYFL